jgi:Raf kinase inhibitor-like YbhB/YbcL family protein
MERCALFLAVALLATPARAMQLSSPDFSYGSWLAPSPVKCGGANVSPALQWSGEPASTKSFALTVFDPDAHGGWWHWIVLDIPANVHAMVSGAGSGTGLPQGAVQGLNDFHRPAYDGPCPPPGSGVHHYQFTLWALPAAGVPFSSEVTAETIRDYLASHALAKAELVGLYRR